MSHDKNAKINEAINSFYKLKSDYEGNFYEKYLKSIINSNQSRREKKSRYQKLPKPKCINCNRNVGSIFTIKRDEKELLHKYVAKCGDIVSPCPLNIRITTPIVETYENVLDNNINSNGSLNTLKKDIIKAKNDLIFGYINDKSAFELFDKLASELKEDTDLFDYTFESYVSVCDNPAKNELLKKTQVEFELQIAEFKKIINDFNKKNDEAKIHTAIEFYINNIMPMKKKIREMKYAYNKVEYIDDKYTLIQKKNTLEQLEFSYGNPILESYIVGTRIPQKTLKHTPFKPNKTKKQQPTLVLVEEEPQEEESEEEETQEEAPEESEEGAEEEEKNS